MKTHATLVVVVGDDDESIGTPTNVSKIHKLQYCFSGINIFPPNAPHDSSAAKTPQFLAQGADAANVVDCGGGGKSIAQKAPIPTCLGGALFPRECTREPSRRSVKGVGD